MGFLWSLTRILIQAPAGRQRFNVLGAINAESVCILLDKLHNLNLGVPITLFLDNARYQHCALSGDWKSRQPANRVVFLAFLPAKFELDRTLVEVCQEEVLIFEILSRLSCLQNGHQRLS